MGFKRCSKCGIEKPLTEFHKLKQSKDGHRPDCKTCRLLQFEKYKRENPFEYRVKVMASTILKRLKYCHRNGYDHLKCYKENNVKCFLGETADEIAKVLTEHFKDDIIRLLSEGKTPSVDRIDPKGHYEISNIRIIDVKENGILGFKNANEPRKKPVRAIFRDGTTKDYESIREAERDLGIHHSCIRRLIERNGTSRKDKIKFMFIEKD
jgi:hypothetical protein